MKKIERQRIKEEKKLIFFVLLFSILLAFIVFAFTKDFIKTAIFFPVLFVLGIIFVNIKKKYNESIKVRKIEEIFPDFIELMASNLRAGMTIDKAILLSSRKEFSPLDEEILRLGKDIVTGKDITIALYDMGQRIKSEKIQKTIDIISSGIRAGGNISILLEETAINLRERQFVEKKAASNVLMYVIFIFFAVAVGSPLLFGLSSVLVEVLTRILSTLPSIQNTNLAFTLTKVNISVNFIFYFCLAFMVATNILASFVLGLVNKGDERAGVKYILPLLAISISLFFGIRHLLLKYFSGIIPQ